MRPPMIAGIVLLVLGVFVLIQGGTFSQKRDVLKIGDLKVTASEEKTIPTWVGGAALIVGVVLLVGGARKKN